MTTRMRGSTWSKNNSRRTEKVG